MNRQDRRCRYLAWLAVAGLVAGLVAPSFSQEAADVPAGAEAEPAPMAPETETAIREHPARLSDYDLPGLDEKIYLKTLVPWDVVQLIEFLAHQGGLNNIVIGAGVSGLTKLKFDGVTVGDALEIVLSVNNLAYEVQGGIISVMTDEEYQAKYGASFYDNKQVRIVELSYADPTRVAGMLEPVKSAIGTVVSDPVTGTLILIDTPEKIREMMAVIEKADITTVARLLPTETRTFILQYADLDDVQGEVSSLLSKEAGSVRVDRRTKSLIVTDLPHVMPRVEDLIAVFDARPKEVFIESKIVQVSLTDDFRFGINWDHLLEGIDPRFSLRSISQPGAISTLGEAKQPTGSLTYKAIVGEGDLNVVIEALSEVGDTRILSNPHVAALDGKEATIKVITDQPYAEAQLESGTTNVVGETIRFIEVGVSLSVTPRINDEAMISMDIKPEVSSVVGSYQAFRVVPIVRKSYAETTVMIKDSETIIIAGMIENAKEEVDNSVPLLGKIPVLGLLFRSTSDRIVNSEMVVFLTPRIISGEEPFLRMKDRKKAPKPMRALESARGKPLRPVR